MKWLNQSTRVYLAYQSVVRRGDLTAMFQAVEIN